MRRPPWGLRSAERKTSRVNQLSHMNPIGSSKFIPDFDEGMQIKKSDLKYTEYESK